VKRQQQQPDMKKLVAMIPWEMHERLREFAERHDRTPSAEVRRAIRQYLDREQEAA
jgi:predicted transcriptional regulator